MTDSLSEIDLEIVIPVYNEGGNIRRVLDSLNESVKTPFRVHICYDSENVTTLPHARECSYSRFKVILTKNNGKGPHAAVMTGFEQSRSPAVLVIPADDTLNAGIIDSMYEQFLQGNHIVVASRFMDGGTMKGCPWVKAIMVRTASSALYWLARIPVRDATNGFRLFSRKLLQSVKIESTLGFTYSIELLVK